MPIRELYCRACDFKFEKRYYNRKEFEDERDITPCEKCGEVAEPLCSRTLPPIFYGSGFHTNDYKGK